MPAKNTVKTYLENGYYHLYNRGVEKRDIFMDKKDYQMFLYLLKTYLSSPQKAKIGSDPKIVCHKRKNLAKEIILLAYCLMPNHFHLMVKQKTRTAITKLIRAVNTHYVTYFNKRYNRVGTLFQSKYKAALIDNDTYFLHLSRYIHLNPLEVCGGSDPKRELCNYPYSSYAHYLGKYQAEWIKPQEILSFFKTAQKTTLNDILSYQSFVEDYAKDSSSILEDITLE